MRHGSDARPRAHTDLDPAEIFGFGGDRVSERKKLDLDCAERRAQYPRSQILGEGLLRFDRRADEEMIRAYIKNQELADKAAGPDATEARILIKSDPLSQHPS
jgi:hypothetical protein